MRKLLATSMFLLCLAVSVTLAADSPTRAPRFTVGSIAGLAQLVEQSGAASYTIPGQYYGAIIAWQITGDAAILPGAHREFILISPGGPGQFTVSVTVTREGEVTYSATRTVNVVPAGSLPHPKHAAKLALHVGVTQARPPCLTGWLPACARVKSTGLLYPKTYFAHLLVQDASATAGVGGGQLGIDYNASLQTGVDVFSWALCATLEFTSSGPNGPWPAPGSGNLITWDVSTKCQRSEPGGPGTGVVASAGFFYLSAYSPDILRLPPRPVDNQAKVASCNALEDVIGGVGGPTDARLGYATFSADERSPGFNPCLGSVTIRPTTWSAIKGQYAR